MALSRKKYRRVTDLYVRGTELFLRDGTVLWLQVLNPYERDEAAHDAQLARARVTMAFKDGEERQKVVAALRIDGRDETIRKISDARSNTKLPEIVEEMQNDQEWSERIELMNRSDDLLASRDDAERALITRINEEYLAEIIKRQDDEKDFQKTTLEALNDEELLEEYVDAWIERRGADVARAEYQMVEIWYAARVCEGVQSEPGNWDHSGCENHALQAFETKAEVRELPEDLFIEIVDALNNLNMTTREARSLARQGSSSDSSPLPSEPAESMPSTPSEILATAPGI